jgi:putative Mg2+ transporter-C (MgtC) family protein
MGLGAVYYLEAGCASMLILFALAVLPAAQRQIDQLNQYRIITVKCGRDVKLKLHVENELAASRIKNNIVKQVIEKKT